MKHEKVYGKIKDKLSKFRKRVGTVVIYSINSLLCMCMCVCNKAPSMGCQFNRKIESKLCDYDTYCFNIMHLQVILTARRESAASESILAMTVNRVHACMWLD